MIESQISSSKLGFDAEVRNSLWETLVETIETYLKTVEQMPVAPILDIKEIRSIAESFTFAQPLAPEEAVRTVTAKLMRNQVHTPHPQYFGLFNPAPTTMSIAADAIAATLNPQLAAWSHSPLAAEMERHLLRSFGQKFGLPPDEVDGVFTSGGAEANLTAVLAALHHSWPEVNTDGLRGLKQQPVFYVSAEAHHSFSKAARASGLGTTSLREVAVTEDLTIDPDSLSQAIERNRASGDAPFMVVATAGTTGAGAIDPLSQIAQIAHAHQLWFHVDAAWGGAAALVPELRDLLSGIELADSITFDAHKWLSVSMGAGMFLTRHPEILSRCFNTQTAYMPREGERMTVTDPFTHSLQWSRRFIGLKLFLSLVVAGWDGYADAIRHQTEMGSLLRTKLTDREWRVVNKSPLPLVCFTDAKQTWDLAACQKVADAVVHSGQAWISTIQLGSSKKPALRACITNYATMPHHLDVLLTALDRARAEAQDRSAIRLDPREVVRSPRDIR